MRDRAANLLFRLAARLAGKHHIYLSTACLHELTDSDPNLHGSCRQTCKTCSQPCICKKHPAEDDRELPPPWVDQARNAATRLLAVIERRGVDLRDQDPDLYEEIRDGRAMFWLRGEAQPAGEWHPTDTDETKEG